MGGRTKIQWAKATWSPVTGCTKVSEGCRNCYAERLNNRVNDRPFSEVVCHPERLDIPFHWKRPRKPIFVCSMGDLFHEGVPDEFIDRVMAVITLTRRHRYIVLTKRPERMYEYIMRTGRSIDYLDKPALDMGYTLKYEGIGLVWWPITNLILGVSVEDQATADERIPWLLKTPAVCRAVSYEPALGSIDFTPYLSYIGYKPINQIGGDYATENERRNCLPSGTTGRTGNRDGRENLASHEQEGESLERGCEYNEMQKAEGGERYGAIFASENNDESGENICSGSSPCMETFPRINTTRDDGKPQERQKEGQSSGKPRTGDIFTTGETLNVRPRESQRYKESIRGEKSSLQIDGQTSNRDKREKESRDEADRFSERIQRSTANHIKNSSPSLSWIICGGESGPNAHPMHPDLARSARDQCVAAGVPFWFKQWGEWVPILEEGYEFKTVTKERAKTHIKIWDDRDISYRVGKKAAGNTLDGQVWEQVPEVLK